MFSLGWTVSKVIDDANRTARLSIISSSWTTSSCLLSLFNLLKRSLDRFNLPLLSWLQYTDWHQSTTAAFTITHSEIQAHWVTSLFGWVRGWDQTLIQVLNFGLSPDRGLGRSKQKVKYFSAQLKLSSRGLSYLLPY